MAKAVVQTEDGQRVVKHGAPLASGTTFAEGDLVGLNTSGELVLATGVSGSFIAARGFVLTGSTVGAFGATKTLTKATYFERGKLNGLAGLTQGGTVYLGTAGGLTQTRPGNYIQAVGYAVSETEVIIDITPYHTTT